jgi:TatD DNase family protein
LGLISKQEHYREKVVAIGEIGLDFSYSQKQSEDNQIRVLNELLQAAEKLSLPVIMHSRRTAPKIMSILSSFNVKKVLFHWFSGPVELLPKIVENRYCISEVVPFSLLPQNSRTRQVSSFKQVAY